MQHIEGYEHDSIGGRAWRPASTRLIDGRYEIRHHLGSCNTSQVYAARDHVLGRSVALKSLTTDRIGEVAAMACVESPHVVAIHDVAIGPTGLYLVMQRVHGSTIAQEVGLFGSMPVARACRIAVDILAGLTAIHSRGLVHRDLTPRNVMLDLDDRAVLLDLGVARPRRRSAAFDVRTHLDQVGRLSVYLVTGLDAEAGLANAPAALRELVEERHDSIERMRGALSRLALDPQRP